MLEHVEQGDSLAALADDASRLCLYSHKHCGVYQYAFRILRPIWRMKITNYASTQRMTQQNLNRDAMIPAQERLISLLNELTAREDDFVVQTCKNRDLIPRESGLVDEVVMINRLDTRLSDEIEVAQRKSGA